MNQSDSPNNWSAAALDRLYGDVMALGSVFPDEPNSTTVGRLVRQLSDGTEEIDELNRVYAAEVKALEEEASDWRLIAIVGWVLAVLVAAAWRWM